MKEVILKFLYYRYKSYFYAYFVGEFFDEVPKAVQEPALNFLSQYHGMMEKWILSQAYVLQRKIQTEPAKIHFFQGALFIIRLLNLKLNEAKKPLRKSNWDDGKSTSEPEKKDGAKGIADSISAIKLLKEELGET